jgi:hypothetical protein
MAKSKKEVVKAAMVDQDLMHSMDLTVPVVGDVAQIELLMEVYGGDKGKDIVDLSDEDRHELATLFVVKGGMSGISKKAKEYDDRVKEVGSPWLLARGVKKAKVPGVGTFTLVEGCNMSISADALRKVLVKYLPASDVPNIIEEVTKKTPYVTLQFKAE